MACRATLPRLDDDPGLLQPRRSARLTYPDGLALCPPAALHVGGDAREQAFPARSTLCMAIDILCGADQAPGTRVPTGARGQISRREVGLRARDDGVQQRE